MYSILLETRRNRGNRYWTIDLCLKAKTYKIPREIITMNSWTHLPVGHFKFFFLTSRLTTLTMGQHLSANWRIMNDAVSCRFQRIRNFHNIHWVVVIVAQWRDIQCFKELFSAKILVTIMMMMTMIVAPGCALSLWFSFGFMKYSISYSW